MKAVGKGIVLAVMNVLLIAFGIAMMDNSIELAGYVIVFGLPPGLLAGLVIGAVAGILESSAVGRRIATLAFASVSVVVLLAQEFQMQEMIPVASIPSVVAALILERWTRKVQVPMVPVAQVR